MPTVSKDCARAVNPAIMEGFGEYIPCREMLRVLGKDTHGLDLITREYTEGVLDGSFNEAPNNAKVADLQSRYDTELRKVAGGDYEAVKAFVNDRMEPWVSKYGMPGWNNTVCAMSWKEYGCFCNGAAKAYIGGGNAALELYLKPFTMSNVQMSAMNCSADVLNDNYYEGVGEAEAQPAKAGFPWWALALPVGALIFGIVYLSDDK